MAHDTPARALAITAHAAFQQRCAAARDGRLTEAHRIRKLAFAYVSTCDRLKALAVEHTAQVSAERQRLEQALYGLAGDPEGLRTAIDAASVRITKREQAAAALRRAERTGDEVAALAAFNVAAEHGWSDVSRSYLAKRPDAAAAHAALVAHEQAGADANEKLFGPLRFPPLPVELAKHRNALEQRPHEPPAVLFGRALVRDDRGVAR